MVETYMQKPVPTAVKLKSAYLTLRDQAVINNDKTSMDELSKIADRLGIDKERRYSDTVPYNERRYWYFTLHGVGVGAIPSHVNVLDIIEGQNDKGTMGEYMCLDAVLNTSELERYGIRELMPPPELLLQRRNEIRNARNAGVEEERE